MKNKRKKSKYTIEPPPMKSMTQSDKIGEQLHPQQYAHNPNTIKQNKKKNL
jgi:hypothetical protein